jgi:hypothetical protein
MSWHDPNAGQSGGLPFNIPDIPALLNTWVGNFSRNTRASFSRLTLKDGIRLVIITCGYMLIARPLLMKLGAKLQAKQHEKDGASGQMDGNSLQGGQQQAKVSIPGVDSDSEEEEGGEWGRSARLRQRKLVKRAMELKEQIDSGELDSDDDIKDLLE